MKTREAKIQNVRLTDDSSPVTVTHYLKLQQKLGFDLADYQSLMGISVKEHYLMTLKPDAPLSDPGLCLHIRLLDEFPELVDPGPEVMELVRLIKQVKRDYPDTALPMPANASLVGLMLGRNVRTSSTWSTGRATPPRKIMALVSHLLTLLKESDAPDRLLARYCKLVGQEGQTRGIADIFKEKRWP